MTVEFTLTPHVKAILGGRGMCKVEVVKGERFFRLICDAQNCVFQDEEHKDSDFGKDILVKGYAVCPRCGTTTDYIEGLEWNDRNQSKDFKCKVCKKKISKSKVIWTQKVVSKHRKNKHKYYHKECWEAKFIDLDNIEIASFIGHFKDNTLLRLIRWAERLDKKAL